MFIPYQQALVGPGAQPERYLMVLHGVFGSGSNWRLFMRDFLGARPDWGVLLVDLRGHGQSQGAPSPHDLDAVAADLCALESRLPGPVKAVLGHSLGGKVALAYAAKRHHALEQLWVLDSRPGTQNNSDAEVAMRVLAMLEQFPAVIESRDSFIEEVRRQGYSSTVANWLAMNVRPTHSGYQLRLDLEAIRGILMSYFTTDCWSEIERPIPGRQLHMVVAGTSSVVDAQARARLKQIAMGPAEVFTHTIEEAGHWLHVDAPEVLRALLVERLQAPGE